MMTACIRSGLASKGKAEYYFRQMVKSSLVPDRPSIAKLVSAVGQDRAREICDELHVNDQPILPAQAKPLLLQNRLARERK